MAYREAPAAPGLPFPRKNLGLFIGLAIALAVFVFLLPLPLIVGRDGWMRFREGGFGMYLLLLLSLLIAGGMGVLGFFAVRGARAPAAVLVALPALPIVVASLCFMQGYGRAIGAVEGEAVDPSMKMRILAEGLAEVDGLFVFGCVIGAAAFGTATVALLGQAASLDRTRLGAPASGAWIASLVLGIVGLLVAVGLRLAMRAHLVTVLVAAPALVLVTALACSAARNGALARGWHDAREANTWLSSFFGAALAATAGVVLIDIAAMYLSESKGLSSIAGESVDSSQKARILAGAIHERGAATIFAWVDGFFAFAIVTAGALSGIGRGPDGRLRLPFGGPSMAALLAVVVVVVALGGARAQALRSANRVADATRRIVPEVQLPVVSGLVSYRQASTSAIVVKADGSRTLGSISEYSDEIVVEADRRARWSAVASAIHAAVAKRSAGRMGFSSYGSSSRLPMVAIRVVSTAPSGPSASVLAPYDIFLGPDTPALRVDLQAPASGGQAITPAASDDMEAVVNKLAALSLVSYDTSGEHTIHLVSPVGRW